MKYFLIVIVSFLSMSCSVITIEKTTPVIFSSFEQATDWICENISFANDDNGNYWQTPEETISKMSGDCEDYSMLIAYYANQFGLDPMIGILPSGYVICIIDGMAYVPNSNEIKKASLYKDVYIESYNEALLRCPCYL